MMRTVYVMNVSDCCSDTLADSIRGSLIREDYCAKRLYAGDTRTPLERAAQLIRDAVVYGDVTAVVSLPTSQQRRAFLGMISDVGCEKKAVYPLQTPCGTDEVPALAEGWDGIITLGEYIKKGAKK